MVRAQYIIVIISSIIIVIENYVPKCSSACHKWVRQSPGAGRGYAENPSPSYTLQASHFIFARWRQLWKGALGSLNERSSNIQAFLYLSLSNSSIPPNHNHSHTPTQVRLGISEPVPEGPASGASTWPGPLPGLPQEHLLAAGREEKAAEELFPSRSRPRGALASFPTAGFLCLGRWQT